MSLPYPRTTFIVKPHACRSPVRIAPIDSRITGLATQWTDAKIVDPFSHHNSWLRKNPADGALFWTGEWKIISSYNYPPRDGCPYPYAGEPTEEEYFTALESGVANTRNKLIYIRKRIWWIGNAPLRVTDGGPRINRLVYLDLAAKAEKEPPNENEARQLAYAAAAAEAEDAREDARIERRDKIRRDGLPPRYLENMAALVELLPEKPFKALLMKAEALRELSRFEEALELLRKHRRSRPLVLDRFWDIFYKGHIDSVLSYRREASFINELCLAQNANVAQFPRTYS